MTWSGSGGGGGGHDTGDNGRSEGPHFSCAADEGTAAARLTQQWHRSVWVTASLRSHITSLITVTGRCQLSRSTVINQHSPTGCCQQQSVNTSVFLSRKLLGKTEFQLLLVADYGVLFYRCLLHFFKHRTLNLADFPVVTCTGRAIKMSPVQMIIHCVSKKRQWRCTL